MAQLSKGEPLMRRRSYRGKRRSNRKYKSRPRRANAGSRYQVAGDRF